MHLRYTLLAHHWCSLCRSTKLNGWRFVSLDENGRTLRPILFSCFGGLSYVCRFWRLLELLRLRWFLARFGYLSLCFFALFTQFWVHFGRWGLPRSLQLLAWLLHNRCRPSSRDRLQYFLLARRLWIGQFRWLYVRPVFALNFAGACSPLPWCWPWHIQFWNLDSWPSRYWSLCRKAANAFAWGCLLLLNSH